MRILLKSILLIFFMGFAQTPTNAIVSFHIETTKAAKPLKQTKKVKFLKLLREFKKYNPKPRTKAEKVILYAFLVIGIIAFIYFLQGSIWLFIIGLLAFLGIKLGKKQREQSQIVYFNEKGEVVVPAQSYAKSKVTSGKSYASRSTKSFFRGLGIFALSFILLIIGAASLLGESALGATLIFLFFLAAITGLVFMGIAFSQSLKSISNKEPDKDKAVLILILSLLFLLPLMFSVLGGIIGLLAL